MIVIDRFSLFVVMFVLRRFARRGLIAIREDVKNGPCRERSHQLVIEFTPADKIEDA